MSYALIKASAIACVLGGLAFAAPAYAVTVIPANGTNFIVLAAQDMETEAIEEDMRPDEVQSDSKDEAKPKAAAPKEGAKSADDPEEKAIEEGMGQGE